MIYNYCRLSQKADILCESFTLLLEQTMAGLSSFELRLHNTERLPRRENGLTILIADISYRVVTIDR